MIASFPKQIQGTSCWLRHLERVLEARGFPDCRSMLSFTQIAISLNTLYQGVTYLEGHHKRRFFGVVTQYQGDWKWHVDP